MSTQWHPVFAELMRLLLADYYEIDTEVPVSDLPRAGDFLIVRRESGPEPPFRGLWNYLSDWNVMEFKGLTDHPEEDDLEKLMHVGSGIAYKINEQRRAAKQEPLKSRQVAFWYLVPQLGDTFLGHARARTTWTYETGGLYLGSSWGHPIRLVAYSDTVVEVDTIPLRLLEENPSELTKVFAARMDLLEKFAAFMMVHRPEFWQEVSTMAGVSIPVNWEAVAKVQDLRGAVRVLPPEQIIEEVGLAKLIQTAGPEKALAEIKALLTPEQWQELLRKQSGFQPEQPDSKPKTEE